MGVLIAAEHVGIGCAGWVYRAILSEISGVLTERGQDASVQLYNSLDARDLTLANQEAFLAALVAAQERSEVKGAAGWRDPAYWAGYAKLFASLALQAKQSARGHAPDSWPNLVAFPERDPTRRSGPGWPGQEAN